MTETNERAMLGRLSAGVILGVMLLGGASARAQDNYAYPAGAAPQESTPPIVWVGTVATNIFYIPAKCVYAAFGGITGGLGWLLTGGNTQAANGIWYPTIYGTYVVTPAMLQGKEDCRFRGP